MLIHNLLLRGLMLFYAPPLSLMEDGIEGVPLPTLSPPSPSTSGASHDAETDVTSVSSRNDDVELRAPSPAYVEKLGSYDDA